MTRFYIQSTLIGSKIIQFNQDQTRKMRKVLRMRVGDTVEVFDGTGWLYMVKLIKLSSEHSTGEITSKVLHEKPVGGAIMLQSLPKNLKNEFIIQKCSELGVNEIIFFASEYSQVKASVISKSKIQRWRSIAESACEQCGRLYVPEISVWTDTLDDLITRLQTNNKDLLFLDKSGKKLRLNNSSENIAFFVGPEGGFSPQEKELFERHGVGSIRIADAVLRNETAGMAFLAQLFLTSGDTQAE